MSPVKAKISLTPEQATLLIPLYAKAQADNPIFFDPEARAILDQVDYDFTRLRVPYKTVVLVCQRAKKLDAITRDFLTQHPDGVVLHLGCGLDGRFHRVANPRGAWYDLDMPPVIDLRRQFYSAAAGYQMLASSVTDLRWVEAVAAAGRPVLVVAEGLLMYLSEAEVRQLVGRLCAAFPDGRLCADVFSRMAARSAARHPSLKHTRATIGWGVDDSRDLETWAPGLRLLEEWPFTHDPDLSRLSLGYRLAYKLAGAFPAARQAQRIVHYQW